MSMIDLCVCVRVCYACASREIVSGFDLDSLHRWKFAAELTLKIMKTLEILKPSFWGFLKMGPQVTIGFNTTMVYSCLDDFGDPHDLGNLHFPSQMWKGWCHPNCMEGRLDPTSPIWNIAEARKSAVVIGRTVGKILGTTFCSTNMGQSKKWAKSEFERLTNAMLRIWGVRRRKCHSSTS